MIEPEEIVEPLFSYREPLLYCHHSLDETPDPDMFSVHAHEMPEIYLFWSGHGKYLVEGTQYPLEPGDVLIMRQAETHKLLIEPDAPYRRLAVHFSPALLNGVDPDGRLLRPFDHRALGQHNRYPAARFPHLAETFSGMELVPGLERFSILSRLLRLLTELAAAFPALSGEEPDRGGFAAELVGYVNAHLYEPISLSDLSRAFARSTSQLSRVFRAATGTSLWDYVLLKRLLSARAMLQRGESAMHTAAACGFSDYSAFYRAYQKQFHHAPSDDRLRGD